MWSAELASGYAALRLVAPLQYQKIKPRPVARNTTDAINGRSDLITNPFTFGSLGWSPRAEKLYEPAAQQKWLIENDA
jgi:hypothetical protein